MGRYPCCKVDDEDLKKGPWTPDEDEKLMDYIRKNGHTNWQLIPKRAGLNRCGKSCRLRWTNYLRPDIKRGAFSIEEEEIIINLHSLLGNKWSRIASHLPGRTDNEIKNFYNTHLRKKLLRLGIDPRTHKPISDLNLLINLSNQFPSEHNLLMNNPLAYALRLQTQVTEMTKIQQLLQTLFAPINTNNPLLSSSNSQENYFATSSSHVITNNVAATNNTQLLDSLLVNSSGTMIPNNMDNSTSTCNVLNHTELSCHQGESNSKTNTEADDAHVVNQDYDANNTFSQINYDHIPAWEKNHEDDEANSSFWSDIFQ